ncbi:MAG: hypothetical protein M5U09_20475 [Gammaproteobacteria bacterium]|nr:hypothetical protein [Gammaproteobacteria bacterium]
MRARRAERERDLLVAVADAARGATSMEQAMDRALEAVCKATGWDYAEAWLADGPHWRRLPGWYGSRERFAAFHPGLANQTPISCRLSCGEHRTAAARPGFGISPP